MASTTAILKDTVFFDAGSLTAAGVTSTFIAGQNNQISATYFVIQTKVENIGTNVVLRIEGSLDNIDFFNLNSADTTITTNGITGFVATNLPLKGIRARLVSISGGTPTVHFQISAK